MYRYIAPIFCLFFTFCATANDKLDSLLLELDKVVLNRQIYSDQKESELRGLKRQLESAGSTEQKFSILDQMFNMYGNYQTDSAYAIVEKRLDLASEINTPDALAQAYMNLAEVYRTTGLYKETLEVLAYVNQENWHKLDLPYYFHLYHSLYMLMADYAVLDADKKKYNKLLFDYKDSLLQVLNQNDMSYDLVLSSYYTMLGEFQNALDVADKAYKNYDSTSPLINYTLSEIYHYLGDAEKEKIYLAQSAIEDLKSGVKEYISLHRLAALLYNEGDIDRAYTYMKCAMEDAVFSNSRLRTLEVSKMLPLINKAYDLKMKQERQRLVFSLIVILVLVVVLLISIFYIYKQVKQLSVIREQQRIMNEDLQSVNNELKSVNLKLVESDHVKEEYIGQLFKICSTYISKLEDFRLLVKRNIQTGQVKQLNSMVSSSTLVADELKDFYKNFDSIFLKIYPSFVEEFNDLMTDEGKITPKEGELLTPELRIFALVRLGINDSVKIAEFLHYSPQTIYNYRLKVRNKSKCEKDEFLDQIIRIGEDDLSSKLS